MAIIIVNFKAYEEAQGGKAITLAKACQEIAQSSGIEVVVAPALLDVSSVRNAVSIPVFSQHVDALEPGAHTGQITASAIKAAGAHGTLINHSERPVSVEQIHNAVRLCRKHGLVSVVCVPSLEMVKNVVESAPDYIAYEPPELVGGNISVTTAKPDIIKKAVEMVKEKNKNVKVLCGAGIKNSKDVQTALKLGCTGVLVSSGIVKAKDQKKALFELLKAQ